jgi:hypothetical protein
MKRTLYKKALIALLTIVLVTDYANSQTKFVWGKIFGSEKDDYVLNHVNDGNGNLFVAGKTTGTIGTANIGKNDGFLTKIDSLGNILWSRQFGTTVEEDIQWCAIDKSANVYITGSTAGDLGGKNAGKEDVFITKYDSQGKILWTRQFGTEGSDVARSVFSDNRGYIYITGNTDGKLGQAAFGKADCFIIKVDTNGNLLFSKQFGTSGDDYGYCVTAGAGSDVLVCGSTWGELAGKSKGLIDVFTGQFTENGDLVKYNQFGSEGVDIAEVINMDAEHNIYIGGMTTGNFGGQQTGEGDAFLIKVNEKGEILWNNQFGTANNDGLRAISFNTDISDNFLVSGIQNLPPANAYVRMYNKDGKLLWERIFMGCSGKDAKFDNKGNIYHVGLTMENPFGRKIGNSNFYLAKFKLDREYMNR